jgi:transcription antitermination factor NusG
MEQKGIPYPGGFFPGDQVIVVDGTFCGMQGRVASPDEEKAVGGEKSIFSCPKGYVWVLITIYVSPVSVFLEPDQIRRNEKE